MLDLSVDTNTPDLFAFRINYNGDVQNSLDGAVVPLYNGNISETFWRSESDNLLRKYGYKYDKLNRLLEAYYQKPEDAAPERNSYNEQLTYDKNGNIKTLMRHGDYDEANTTIRIDELEYVYDGYDKNRLLKVRDMESNPSGFSDSPDNDSDDYTYDDFGNMISDRNKGIASITYNHLNLPVKIDFDRNKTISYLYTASGVKVRKHVHVPGLGGGGLPIDDLTDYLGGYQYLNTFLQYFPTAEGYVDHTPTDANRFYNYVYQYKDHLGNIRMNYAVDPADNVLKIKEENHYYPFGLKHQNYLNDRLEFSRFNEGVRLMGLEPPGEEEPPFQVFTKAPYNYKYNAKEWQDELGLNMYDYGARNYDPAIGRWMNIDPLAEVSRRWSPYTYCYDNPVRFVDPDGMLGIDSMGDNDGWIKRGSDVFYDSTVTTQEQATAVYGDDAKHYGENASITAGDGSYKYQLGTGGSVSLNGEKLDTSQDITTPAGNTILSPESKTGSYGGIGIGGALGGGISLEAGLVKDATGNWGAYFSFAGNVGFGGDAGLKMGDTTPTGDNLFALTDFAGKSNSFSAGLGPMGGETGGSDGSKEGVSRMNPASFGKNSRGYTFGNGGPSLISPKLNPSLSVGGMFSGSKTWVWDF